MTEKTTEVIQLELNASTRRADAVEKELNEFIHWIINTLKPSGLLPPLTDKSLAKQLVEDVMKEADNLRRTIKIKEKEWEEERTALVTEATTLKTRILKLEKELVTAHTTIETIQTQLKELKTDIIEHQDKTEEVLNKKDFITVLKGFFTRK